MRFNLTSQISMRKTGDTVKQGYRVIIVDKDGVMVCESQLTEKDLAHPEAFVSALKQSIEEVEEEEP